MTDKSNDEQKSAADKSAEDKKRPSLDEIRKSRNTFGGNGTFGGGKIGGGNSRGKGGGLSRPGGSARGR
jgi:membrane protein involved in colicin uptake